MSLHISTSNGAKPEATVLMPGDPLRAQFIAESFLESPVRYSEIRNMYGYSGTYKGVPVSVQGSGMGMPSMGIYSWELFDQHHVENIIRIGTMGSFNENVHVGDTVLALTASTDSSYMDTFHVEGQFSPCASYGLLTAAQEASREMGISVYAGNVLSSDHFYEADDDWWKCWQRMGVVGVEMETAALYSNAAFLKKNALAMFTVSDHFILDEIATVEERQTQFTDMMKVALETAVRL